MNTTIATPPAAPATTTTTPLDGTLPNLKRHTVRVLLIDDQVMIGEAVRRMLAPFSDIELHFCPDPTKAADKAREVKPTLILQDLVMPHIDGLTMVRTFRSMPETADVPMIVLSSKEEAKTKAEAFAAGANDYLVKLPDKIELIARIRYHSTGYINLLERNEAFEALRAKQEELAAELTEAADYVRSLLPAKMKGPLTTDWIFIPSTSLGGDSFGYQWLDDDHFAIFLLDVCGHGVGAALLSVSAMNVVTMRTLPEVDLCQPDQLLTAMNLTFPMEKQNNMYFTMWYGVYQKSTRKLTFSSGGHPPAVLISGDPAAPTIQELRAPGMVVGAFDASVYKAESVIVPPGAKLYLFSDGVYEVKRPDLPMMELEELVQILAKPATPDKPKLGEVFDEIVRQQGNDQFVDDFSIVEFVIE